MINSFIKINLILLIIFIFILIVLSGKTFAFDCTSVQKYSHIWQYNNCGGDPNKNKKDTRNTPWKGYPYNSGEIPQDAKPDYKILKHYLIKYISYGNPSGRRVAIKIKKKKNKIKEFKFNLKEDDFVIEQLNETALLSYLMYENGEVVIDKITPKDRFGKIFKNKTKYVSNSVGKSIISYITGHAICRNYISGINHKLNDWPILENTLYYDQPIINLLNMASGDQKYFDNKSFINSDRWVNGHPIQSLLKKELKNSKASKIKKYFYSNMNTNIIASYVLYKMGHKEFKKMLNEMFVDKIGIEYDVVMFKQDNTKKNQNSLTYGMFLTRYDYLRVAVAMLNDWNKNSCEGKYLKSLYENRIDKGFRPKDNTKGMSNSNHYAGQFYVGMSGKGDVPIFLMSGFGGQNIAIDFENNKITAIMAIHRDYDWMKLVHSKF